MYTCRGRTKKLGGLEAEASASKGPSKVQKHANPGAEELLRLCESKKPKEEKPRKEGEEGQGPMCPDILSSCFRVNPIRMGASKAEVGQNGIIQCFCSVKMGASKSEFSENRSIGSRVQ